MESSLSKQPEEIVQNEGEKSEPTTIFQSDTTFKELGVCDEIHEACTRLNFKHPTKIQKEVIPYALQGKDIIGLAETGSGKTLAFGIPIIQSLLDNPQPFYALVMAPTRELCVQIRDQFDALGASVSLKCCVIVGGLDPMSQAIALSKKPHIVIGTPGRLLYHLENTKGFALKNLKYLIFDEADKLLNMDFEKEINQILEVIPKTRNTYLFSATMTNKVSKLQRASLQNPVKVEVSSKYQTVSTLTQNYIFIPAKYKDCYLTYLLNEFAGNSTIIFINTCMNAVKLVLMLRNLGFGAVGIHGKLTQVKRLAALNKFKIKEKNILVATDVASRGLDIPSVDLVINYDIPQSAKEYVHRVGRTARAGRAGKSVSLVTQYDIENYQKIEHLLGKKLDAFPTEEEEVLIFNERVQEAQRIAGQSLKEMIDSKLKKGGKDSDDEDGGKNQRNSNGKRQGKPVKQHQLKKFMKFDM